MTVVSVLCWIFFSDAIVKHRSCFTIFNPFCDINDIELMQYHIALLKHSPQWHSPERAPVPPTSEAVTWESTQGEFRYLCESFTAFCHTLLLSWAHAPNPMGKYYKNCILKCLKSFTGAVSRLFSLSLSHIEGFLIIMDVCLITVPWGLLKPVAHDRTLDIPQSLIYWA